MCFSATASFVTAGVTGLIGLAALGSVSRRGDLLLAATPLVFAAQQAIEGLIWLKLPHGADASTAGLAMLFLFFAQPFWPAFTPVAVILAEDDARRRRFMLPWLVIGLCVSAYLLLGLFARPHEAVLAHEHIVYDPPDHPPSLGVPLAYLAAVALPLLMSSQRTILALGVIVMVGSVVAYLFYFEAFQSVWCYFAAAASVVILGHFQWSR
ncbi:MAG TPA: DUF6629 family protein, partial [Phenylobacterium sp.]|nr:DUF6629 family protein [Phenylobacterium sp.]